MADQESIDYQIRIEAANALRSLENITAEASSMPEILQAVETELQKLSDKFGISLGAAQVEFQNTIRTAERLRDTMAEIQDKGLGDLFTMSPYLQNLSNVQSPFGELGDAAGFKALNDARREAVALAKDQQRSEASVAAEINAETVAREKAIDSILKEVAAQDALENIRVAKGMDAEYAAQQKAINEIQKGVAAQDAEETKLAITRRENLDILNQEQMAVEKEGAALQQQLQTYGQVSKTASEMASYLRSFAGTEQGQSILTKFFGNYQQAQGVAQQINVIKSSVLELSKATGSTFAQSAKVFQEQFSNIPGITQQTSSAVRQLNKEFDQVPEKTGRAVRSIDAVRIALGALVAMLVFQVIQAISNAFGTMIKNVKESELAIYNLINAERRLSEQGIDVTPKGLQETIDMVQKLVPILSQIQAQELVSRVATNVAPALHLTNEEIKQLTESIALLYIRNKALGKSFDEVESQVTNAFLTGKVSQGINQLGVKISDQIVKDEALRLGLVKTEKEFDNLSGEVGAHVKAVAMLSVVYKNAKQDVGSVGEYMVTLDAQSSHLSTSWSNLLTTLGKIFGPTLAQGLKILADDMDTVNTILQVMAPLLKNILVYTIAWSQTIEDISFGLKKPPLKDFRDNLEAARQAMQELGDAKDTPTAVVDSLGELDKVDFGPFKQKIEDIIQDTKNAFTDLRANLLDKLADINLEYARKATDAQTDLNRKLEDIDAKYAQNVNDIKKKQREEDKKDEEKYQLALWELRMRYLMDLEDALHAGDARQILRLQRQYAFDKEDAARKHALDTKNREQDQKAQLDDAKKKKDREIADAKADYARKLEDQRIAKQRELADLQTWYLREFHDLQTAQQRKLQTLIKGWIDEQKITQQNAAQVYAILARYFGPGGMTDALYAYMVQSLVANAQAATASLGQIGSRSVGGVIGSTTPTGGTSGTRAGSSSGNSTRSRAEGGSMIATRPTSVTFGEKGAEAALFLPLNHLGKNAGRVDFSGNGMGGGMDGTIVVRLDLSPDLEARVVENSMNGVANAIVKVNRSRS